MNDKILVFKISKYSTFHSLALLCFLKNGELDQATCRTLLDFIMEHSTSEKEDASFEELLQKVERGEYQPQDPRFADWDMNAKQIWLCPPVALPGHMAITNEYTEYSIDPDSSEEPQQFTFNQYRTVLKFWRECQQMIEGKDLSTIEDFRREMPFPEK
ncbi:hypothetical protein [Neisseria sp. Ec49-e6-T10]|uniref:hypothetical protein n=1 Tax=Neisseria sp. Ec49-e6-T10 TaxID=3140744 RepID=UPI003EBD3F96